MEGQPACKADSLTTICEPNVYKMWEPQRLTTQSACMACHGDSFAFFTVTRDDSGASISAVGQFCIVKFIIAEGVSTLKIQLRLSAVIK
jgi:hypothetical protein